MDRRFISWKDTSDLLLICGSSITGLSLVFDDISFISISDYAWFSNSLQFAALDSLAVSSKNATIPEKICIELLRRCQPQSLESLSFTFCLSSFSGTSWYLLHDRISPYLKEITLTPNLKSTDWDNEQFQKGVLHLAKTSGYLRKVDFSGHSFGLDDHTLSILLELGSNLTELKMPCGLNDTHLIAIMSCTNISQLKKLDLSCKCSNGRFLDVKKESWPCSRFTDSVLIALMEKAMADNPMLRRIAEVNRKGYEKLEIVLPRFLMEVKTGKKIQTLHWAAQFRGFIYDFKDKEAIFYKGFRLYAPGAKFI
jgi:hypothetical protein